MSKGIGQLVWFTSSYSGGEGGDCVEVALDWRKSSYSGAQGGDCVEIAACPDTVHVRDSKDTTGPILTFTSDEWAAFVGFATND